jgi:predicted transcriptional regulator
VTDAADAIISIHPGYADAILAGEKTIELRRRVPKLTRGSRLWIYATRPTGAVVGVVTIQEVAKASPSTIWKRHQNGAAVDLASYKAYFKGAQEAVAISIEQLRKIRNRFQPPQVLIRLTTSEAQALTRIANYCDAPKFVAGE